MTRTRVAFVMNRIDSGWTGGVNYIVNLLASIAALPDRRIETVLFVPPSVNADTLESFQADEIISTQLVSPRGRRRMAGMASQRVLGRNLAMEWLARRHLIDAFSHMPPAGRASPLKVLSWIPDFQHRRLPGFFAQKELAPRDRGHRTIAEEATRIVLSSEDARSDLATALPGAEAKARVLRFVSGLGHDHNVRPIDELAAEYGLDGPFFHVPNQLWKHKNHRVVIDALGLLRRDGLAPIVLSTGHTGDYRHPGFVNELHAHIAALGVAANFRVLGLIPYADVTALMRHAAAVINPSLFEGWSTTIEEAKSIGKRILLSDIPVHREQAPERGTFFAPDDPKALAEAMKQVLADHDPATEKAAATQAAEALPGRLRLFAETYQNIVLEAVGNR